MQLRIVFFTLLATVPAIACLPAAGDRILARDLAAALPAFSALPESTVIGYAPMPGAVRNFTRLELESIARSHRLVLPTSPAEVCFVVPQSDHIDESAVLTAMRKSLPGEASVVIVELPKISVPQGDFQFAMEGIDPPQPADPTVQTWKGFIRYGANRRMPVWARVRITLERSVVVAKRALKPGETITSDAVEVFLRNGPIRPDRIASSEVEVVGKTVLRSVKAGEAVAISSLDRPALVRRGDAVKVEVINGETHLLFSAVAETNARAGEQVQLRNTSSGKKFFARLESADLAVLFVGSKIK